MWGSDDSLGLGIGLKQRAHENRLRKQSQRAESLQGIAMEMPGVGLYGPLKSILGTESSGPLKDSMWDAWGQAMEEQGVEKLADQHVGERRGMFASKGPQRQAPRVDPNWTAQNDAHRLLPGSVRALMQDDEDAYTGTGKHYQSHDTFTKRFRG